MPLSSRDVLFVMRAQDFASREVRNLGSSFGVLSKQVAAANAVFKTARQNIGANLETDVRKATDSFRGQTSVIQANNEAMRVQNARMREQIKHGTVNTQAAKQYGKQIATNNRRIAQNQQEINAATRAHQTQTTQLKRDAADQVTAAKRARDAEIARVDAIQARAQSLISTGATLAFVGSMMAVAGAMGVNALKNMAVASAEFRQGIALAQTQAEDIGASIQEIEGIATGVAEAIPVPLEQTAEGLYDIYSSLDVTVQGSRRLLEEYSQAAVAGQVELQDAGRATTAVLNAWQLGAKGVNDVNDIMFRLVERGIGTYGEFANSIGRAIPATVRAGQEFDALGASMAFLTRQGLSTEQAATAAARAMELLADPRVVERLEAQGFALRDVHGEFLPLVDILRQMAGAWGDMPAPERARAMLDTFGGAGYRIQARRFFDTVLPNFESFNTEIERMVDRTGATDRAYRTMFEQPQSQIQLLKNNWEILRNEMGEQFLGALNAVIQAFISFTQWIRSLPEDVKTLIAAFAGGISVLLTVVGVLVALRGAFMLLKGAMIFAVGESAISGIVTGIRALTGSVSIMGSGMLGWAAILTGPVGIALAALAVGVAGAVYAYKELQTEASSASEASEQLAKSVGATWSNIEDMGKAADNGTQSLIAFRVANEDTIDRVRELGQEGGRKFLMEMAFTLGQRTGMTPEEIFHHINQLAEASGIQIPITLDEVSLAGSIESAADRVIDMLQDRALPEYWGGWNVAMNQVKEEITSVAEMLSTGFLSDNASDVANAAEQWRNYEEAIRNSNLQDKAKQEAINFLTDELLEMIGVTDNGVFHIGRLADLTDDSAKALEYMRSEGFLTTEMLYKMGGEFAQSAAEHNRFLEIYARSPEVLSGAAEGVEHLTDAEEGLTAAQEAMISTLEDFFDPMGAYTDLVEEMATVVADGTGDSSDSWKDYVDDVTVSLDAYGDALQQQVDDLQQWETNMGQVATRATDQFLEQLTALGPDAAPLIASLATATDEEFNRIQELFATQAEMSSEGYGMALEERLKLVAPRAAEEAEFIAEAMEAFDTAHQAGSDTASGYVLGIESWIDRAYDAAREMGHAATIGARHAVEARSPSRVFMQIGEDVVKGFVIGVLSNVSKIEDAMAGPFNSAATAQLLMPAFVSGVSSKAVEQAIRNVEDLTNSWEEQVEAQEQVAKRAELVAKIKEARLDRAEAGTAEQVRNTARAYEDAKQALEDYDRELARNAEQARINAQLEAANHRLTIVQNRERFYFDRMTTQEQLRNVKERMAAEERYTDEWMSLMRQRQQLVEEMIRAEEDRIDESQRLFDSELDSLNRLLDERVTLTKQMSDREAQYARQVAEAREAYDKKITDRQIQRLKDVATAHEDYANRVKEAEQARRDSLMDSMELDESMSVGDIADLARTQNEQMQEWHEGLLELQRRGMDDEVIKALGIADSPKQLAAVRQLLGGSLDEIDNLNDAMRDRQKMLNDIVSTESQNTMFELASTLEDIQRDHTSRLTEIEQQFSEDIASMRQEYNDQLAGLEQSFLDDMQEFQSQLESIGVEHGRTWTEAIEEGIASGIPGIMEQVRIVQDALRELKAAQAAAKVSRGMTVRESVADMRAALGLSAEAASDQIWVDRIKAGTHTLSDAERRLRQKAGIYDEGGVWPSGTMGINTSGQNEYVFTKEQLSRVGAKTITVEEGAFQFNGPIDSATLPEVQRMLDDLVDHLADELEGRN